MPNWCPATVVKKAVWTDGLFTLHLSCENVLPFEPGQFLQLAAMDGEKRINRPYSVASPHGDVLEFFIVLVEDGELTPRLWALNEGDTLEVSERAAGSFKLSKTPDADNIWLVGTGTGLAPYIAMLRTETPWQRYEKIVLVHGVRYASDLGYAEELRRLQADRPDRFCYVPATTREDSELALHGRIPSLVESGELESAAGCKISADSSVVMLCGNPAMLDSMEELLGGRDMKKHKSRDPGQIVLERYW